MQRLEVSRAVRPIYGSLGVKRLRYILRLFAFNKRIIFDFKHLPKFLNRSILVLLNITQEGTYPFVHNHFSFNNFTLEFLVPKQLAMDVSLIS